MKLSKKIQIIIDELKSLKKQADHYERLNKFKDERSKTSIKKRKSSQSYIKGKAALERLRSRNT